MTTVAARLRRIPSWQVTLGLALLGLGFLIAGQLATERPRIRYTTQERPPLLETAVGLQQQQDALKKRILDLRAQIQGVEHEGEGNAALVRQLNAQLQEARVAAGLIALEGPGVVLQLEDSANPPPDGNTSDFLVNARDIRTVVEELWLSGAEAVAVNGERVTVATAFLDIGGSVLVNSAYLAPPYQVSAIGPKDLYDRLTKAQGFSEFIAARAGGYGIRVSYAEPDEVAVPAYAGTMTLHYGQAAEPTPAAPGEPSPTGDGS